MKSLRTLFFLPFLLWAFAVPEGIAKENAPTWSHGDQTWLTHHLKLPTKKVDFKAEIHFQQQNRGFTQRVIDILSRDAAKVFNYFDHVPSWTVHIVVKDETQANGSATVFPTNIITLYNHPPVGSSYLHSAHDWVQILVIHELVHIVHLDQTRGFVGFLSTVFGSAGKLLPQTVPHWFTEGLATWAETEFSESGRMTSQLIDFEIKRNFLNKSFCQTIDCLDEPGIYPWGRNSYWLGSRFMAWLEKRKSGTMKCLVVENSDNIPFFLNSVFKQCAGAPAPRLFKIFRKTMVKEAIKDYKELKTSAIVKKEFQKIKLPIKRKSVDWQKGFELIGDEYVTVVVDDKEFYFHFLNVQNKKSLRYKPDRRPLKVEKQSPYSIQSKKFLLSEGKYSSLESGFSRLWSIFDRRNNARKRVRFNNDAAYAYMLGKNRFLYLSYLEGRWKVFRKTITKELVKESLVYEFGLHKEVFSPRLVERYGKTWLITKTFDPNIKKSDSSLQFQFEALDISGKSKTSEVIYQSKESFEYAGTCGAEDVFLEKNKGHIVISHPQDKKWNRGKQIINNYQAPFIKEVSNLKIESDKSLLLLQADPYHIYLYQDICNSVLNKLKGKLTSLDKKVIEKEPPVAKVTEVEIDPDQLDDYPNLDHFLPHYWFFNWVAGDNTDILSAQTSLSDPRKIHQFSLSYNFYPGLSKSAPILGYGYNRGDFIFGLGYGETFSKSGFSTGVNSNRFQTVYTGQNFAWGEDWTYSPVLSYDQSSIVDFLSSRKNTTVELSQSLSYSADKYYHFIQSVALNYRLSNVSSNQSKSFMGHQSKLTSSFRLGRNWLATVKGTYGKLDKKGFSSGTIYGGGTNSYGLTRYHDFYGIPYTDAFGNEMTTARFFLDWTIKEVYKGSGLFPFFLKEFHAIAGADYLKTDFLFIDNVLYQKEKATSFFGGVRFETTLGYLMPANFDIIYAMVNAPNGKAVPMTLLQISGGGIWF